MQPHSLRSGNAAHGRAPDLGLRGGRRIASGICRSAPRLDRVRGCDVASDAGGLPQWEVGCPAAPARGRTTLVSREWSDIQGAIVHKIRCSVDHTLSVVG